MRGRQARAGAAAERGDLRGQQPEHLGHDPGADREIMPAQPEQQRGDRHRNSAAAMRPASGIAHSGGRPAEHGQPEQQIGAEAHIGLLADRDEAGIAGEQVPEARQRHIGVDLGKEAQVVAAAPIRRGRQRHDQRWRMRAARRRRFRARRTELDGRRHRSSAHLREQAFGPHRQHAPGTPDGRPESASPDRSRRRSPARRRAGCRRRACPTGCRARR